MKSQWFLWWFLRWFLFHFFDPSLKLTTFETLAKIGKLESFLVNVGLGFMAKSEHVCRGNVGIGRWLFARSITRTKIFPKRKFSNLNFLTLVRCRWEIKAHFGFPNIIRNICDGCQCTSKQWMKSSLVLNRWRRGACFWNFCARFNWRILMSHIRNMFEWGSK